tara:strand:+ start:190 stop:348 length:159 start_codon:yes stop_codon:yes gene_type:complete
MMSESLMLLLDSEESLPFSGLTLLPDPSFSSSVFREPSSDPAPKLFLFFSTG